MSFETRLIAVKRLPRGRRVGYGGDWQAQRDSVVGVAAAGYADGYPWHCRSDTPALVNGRRVAGDRARVDGHDQPRPDGAAASRGRATGSCCGATACRSRKLRTHAGTISYELLAGMSPRVVRQIED